jgi:lysophospholipase L1-like esterase
MTTTKKFIIGILLLLAGLATGAASAQGIGYTPPPYVLYDSTGNPFPTGSGTALNFMPPAFTCYTIVASAVVPCSFSGGGASTFSGLSGVATAAQLPAATTSAQGAVVLPAGAGSNTLGTAAAQPTTAFDAAGAATTAITTAETYSSNAGNLTSGTVANSLLAGTGIVTVNTIPCTLGRTCTIATGATPPATGLLAQYLLIDCTFSNGGTCPDTSGNGNNAVIAGSAVTNGGWGAYLNPGNPYTGLGTPQYINLPTADSTGNLYIINFQIPPGIQNSGTTNYQYQWNGNMTIMGSQGSSGTDNAIIGDGSTNGGAYFTNEGGFAEEMLYGGATSWKNVTVLAHGGVMTLAIYTGAPNRIWVNGVEQTYSSQNGSALPQIPTFWSLGGYHGSGTPSQFMFQGIIGMALVYNTTTTTTALDGLVKQATAYINTTVSQRPNYPVYAPAQNSVSNLVWIGDSIGAGYSAGGTTIQQYLALNNTYTLANNSISSVTARTMNPLFQDRNLSYIGNGGTTPSKCVIAIGTNDVAIITRTSKQIFSDLISMGQQCHRAGGQSILVSQTDRGSWSSQIESLSTMERQNWKASGAFDIFADVNEIPLLGASGASSNGTYFIGDKTHLTTAGQQLYAPAVSNAINYLDGYSSSSPHVYASATAYTMTAADVWLQSTGGATSLTLPPCSGLTGQTFNIFTTTAATVTNSADAAAAIVGSAAVAINTQAVFQVNLYGGPTAVGCNYIRIQ